MAKHKTQINIYAQQYICAVFEKTLLDNGFRCPDGKGLCWYRIKNNSILDTVIFCSNWSNSPLFMDILYESVPLFTKPIYIKNVHHNETSYDSRWDCYSRIPIREGPRSEAANLAPYSDEILVYAPRHGERGLYTLTQEVLPVLDAILTIDDCYLHHKQRHLAIDPQYRDKMYFNMSREFIDEVIYVDDAQLYPKCEERIERAIPLFKKLVSRKPQNQALNDSLKHWETLQSVLSSGRQKEYVETLNQRKNKLLLEWKK